MFSTTAVYGSYTLLKTARCQKYATIKSFEFTLNNYLWKR